MSISYTIVEDLTPAQIQSFMVMEEALFALREKGCNPTTDIVVFTGDSRTASFQNLAVTKAGFPPDLVKHLSFFQQPEQQSAKTLAYANLYAFVGFFSAYFPSAIRLERNEHGKPFWSHNHQPFPIAFSLSDTGPYWALALGPGNLGIDMECSTHVPHWSDLAKQCFSPQEQMDFGVADATMLPPHFLKMWTRKEALLKWRGKELPEDLAAWGTLPGQHHVGPNADLGALAGAQLKTFSWQPQDGCFAGLVLPAAVQKVFFFSNLQA